MGDFVESQTASGLYLAESARHPAPKKQLQCRARVEGSYKGRPFVYEDPPDSPGSQFVWDDGDPSRYWWAEGNLSCDCNREPFLPDDFGYRKDGRCGRSICVDRVVALVDGLPTLELNESRLLRCRLCGARHPWAEFVVFRLGNGWEDEWFGCGHERPVTCPECVSAKPDDYYDGCSVCGCQEVNC
jgi:hypothetical protein